MRAGERDIEAEEGDSSPTPTLPRTPRDLFHLSFGNRVLYGSLIAFFRATGLWRFPRRFFGDFERMRTIDKVYWLHKATNPIRRARWGSGLEAYFESQRGFRCGVPSGFEVERRLSVSAVGDLIHHRFLMGSSATLYERVADQIFGHDLVMANLECPLVDQADKDFVFSLKAAPPLYYEPASFSIVKGYDGRQYDFMATACNHSLDFGPEGVDSTTRRLTALGIAYNGVNAQEDHAREATIIEKGGFRIGLIAYTFGLNAYKPPKGRPGIVNLMKLNDGVAANDFLQIQQQLDHCRRKAVDFVIAHLHWGLEHEFFPTPEQMELAHHLAELGVDLIVGHHPHVLQPVEFYRTRRDPARVVPVYYSLGNLINYFTAPYLCRSGLAQITLVKGKTQDGAVRVYVADTALSGLIQEADERNACIRLVPATP